MESQLKKIIESSKTCREAFMKSYKHPKLKCEHGVFNIDSLKVKLRTITRSTQDEHMEFSMND
jgi:hypothetical protein